MNKNSLTRRDFLQVTGLSVSALSLSSCAIGTKKPAAQSRTQPHHGKRNAHCKDAGGCRLTRGPSSQYNPGDCDQQNTKCFKPQYHFLPCHSPISRNPQQSEVGKTNRDPWQHIFITPLVSIISQTAPYCKRWIGQATGK